MAFVMLDSNGNVTGIFGVAQNEPTPPGYAEIPDDDPRIAAFEAAQQMILKPRPTPCDWLDRVSLTTQNAMAQAAIKDNSGALLLWLLKIVGNVTIDVTAADTQQAVAVLMASGVITTEEQAALLEP